MHQLVRNRQRAAGLLAAMALASWPAIAAAPAATAQPTGTPWIAYVAGGTEVATLEVPGGTTPGGVTGTALTTASAVALSPDGATVYITDSGSGDVTTLDTANGNAVDTISVAGATSLTDIAITPDGGKAYVRDATDGVYPIDLTQTPPVPGGVIAGTATVTVIAISTDGAILYAAPGLGDLLRFNTSDDSPAGPITIAGAGPRLLAIAPDGNSLYTTSAGDVVPVDLTVAAPGGAGGPIDVPAGAVAAMAVAPDGTVYVTTGTNLVALDDLANPIDLTAQGATGNGTAITFTPDDGTILVTTDTGDVVPVTGGAAEAPIPTLTAVPGVFLAVTPDQAPVAALTVDSSKSPATFDASASTVQFGTIASYTWDFGDGSPLEQTTTPTTTHAYAQPGNYTATVTLTSSGGTSTTQVYNGRMVVRNGQPDAVATTALTVLPEASTSGGYVLMVTGANTAWELVVGGVALILGVGFILLARRRRPGRR